MRARMYAALAKAMQRGEGLMGPPPSSTIRAGDQGREQVGCHVDGQISGLGQRTALVDVAPLTTPVPSYRA